jgi:hypothetical protein
VKKAGVDDEVAPLGIEGSGRLCRDGLVSRSSLLLESGNVLPDCDQHVAEFLEFGSIVKGLLEQFLQLLIKTVARPRNEPYRTALFPFPTDELAMPNKAYSSGLAP